jgi:uncharacterized protein YndB with AHSA1/START domain
MTETVQDLSPVVQTVEVGAPPTRIFELWTSPDELVRWWPEAAEVDRRVGGRIRLVFGPGDVTGEIARYEPPHALGFTWVRSDHPGITTHVDVAITDLGDGRSRVSVTHTGWEAVPPDQLAEWRMIHEGGWRHFLGVLGDYVAGRPFDKRPPHGRGGD